MANHQDRANCRFDGIRYGLNIEGEDIESIYAINSNESFSEN